MDIVINVSYCFNLILIFDLKLLVNISKCFKLKKKMM